MRIDLNCDMGESFGVYRLGRDEEIMQYISSANIACGFHAGDPLVMAKTVELACDRGVAVGAHPGYPDLVGFGRRQLDCTPEEIENYLIYQIGALQAFTKASGTGLVHVKPHGSLYLAAQEDEAKAEAVCRAIARVDDRLIYVALAGPRGEAMTEIGRRFGLRVALEAFPDRAYLPGGGLTPRRLPKAVIRDPEEVAIRALMMAKEGWVAAVDGARIPLKADTLCIHGDGPGALEFARRIREVLAAEGVEVAPLDI